MIFIAFFAQFNIKRYDQMRITPEQEKTKVVLHTLYILKPIIIMMSNFVDIDFAIKLNDKKSRRFDLSEAIFKCE